MEEESNVVTPESLYDKFVAARDIIETLTSFNELCSLLDINPKNYKTVFSSLKNKLKSWKCQTLFNKLEKRSKHVDYKNKPSAKNKVLIIGAGPVGLRTAVECAFLGAHVIVTEKRNSFSRNNVLHLWPFLIVDLKSIGVKSFFGKFCAGSLDHISIKRLQLILLKISLFLGVQFYGQTMFMDVVQPSDGKGWRAKFLPESSPLNSVEFDAMVGCDGKSNCLKFKRKEFRGKLAIAITCNFINKQTSEEARVEEISGVAFIYNQEFFHELSQKTGIELENVLYYRDETHYFVMTAKKKSLLNNRVIKQDNKDVQKLLSADNVSHRALLEYAQQAADFATNYQLPHHDFALNHAMKEDVAMFDFTSIHQAESASRMYERKGKRLLMCIAGDVLLEPFWPTGSGCARGFLSAFDVAWMIRGLSLGRESLDLIQERESVFQLLPQTKPDSLIRKHDLYSINPATRYLNLNSKAIKKEQVSHLLDMQDTPVRLENWAEKTPSKNQHSKPIKVKKEVDPDTLLKWCKEQTAMYPNVKVVDMSRSWQNGLAFCAIIHRYRPNLIEYWSLNAENAKGNCEKAFTIAEEHLGIPPKIAARDLVRQREPDTLVIMAYVSLYYETLKQETPVLNHTKAINLSTNGHPITNYRNDQYTDSVDQSDSTNSLPTTTRQVRSSFETTSVTKPIISIRDINNADNFGLAVAIVASPIPNENEQSPREKGDEKANEHNPESKTSSKNRTSKMAIISRLSRRSKKTKLTKKSKKDKESQALVGQDNKGVSLKSYGKTNNIDTIDEVSGGLSSLNGKVKPAIELDACDSTVRTPSSQSKRDNSTPTNVNETDDVTATKGEHRFKRISMLAESVFGDTIVQQPSPNLDRSSRKGSTASLMESEKCHFCNRKVYVAERSSAEGFFFHRTCFRCCVCKCRLLLGNYAYYNEDDDENAIGKFYCKVHYNSLIYEEPKRKKQEEPMKKLNVPSTDKRRRALTQQIQSSDVREAARNNKSSSDDLQLSPKFTNQVRDIQKKLKESLPQLEVSTDQKKPYLITPPKLHIDDVDGDGDDSKSDHSVSEEEIDQDGFEENEQALQTPYDRFTPRSLLDRHPSLLRCSPQKPTGKVSTASFLSASKFSVSTPNLTKLIQEDSMFEEERKKHEEKMNASAKKRIALGAELRQNVETTNMSAKNKKKRLGLSDTLKSQMDEERKSAQGKKDQDIYGSDEYESRYNSYNVSQEESFGAVHRRPDAEKRAQYPVSMAFTDGILASGFKQIAIDIDLDGPEEKPSVNNKTVEDDTTEKSTKKKKLILKKKKAVKKNDTEVSKEEQKKPTSPKKATSKKITTTENEWSKPTEEKSPTRKDVPSSWKTATPPRTPTRTDDEYFSDSSSSSEEEADEKNSTLFQRTFGKKKKKLTKEEAEEAARQAELKKKHKAQKNIRKEMKERKVKRLWEAQSIQRKLNEVDVQMFDLEERAVQVEKELRKGNSSPADTNTLTIEWFDIVNNKNALVRIESELVIQSNSIQLEDRQARLEEKIRDMLTSDNPKSNSQGEVERLTKELVDTVEQRNLLVELLEEDRLRELEEDKNIKDAFAQKAHAFGMDRLV